MGRVDSGASKERAIEEGIMTAGTGGGYVERWVKKNRDWGRGSILLNGRNA